MDYYNEIWKPVKGYVNEYQISSFGRVKSLGRKKKYKKHLRNKTMIVERLSKTRIIVPGDRPNGYLFVTLYNNGNRKIKSVHRLVAEAFIKKTRNVNVVNHKDFDKKNNMVENLEWCTGLENITHAINGNRMHYCFGEKQHSSKLCELSVKEILISSLSIKDLSIKYNVSFSTICDIKKRRTWRHLSATS